MSKFYMLPAVVYQHRSPKDSRKISAFVCFDDPRCCCFDRQRRALLEQDQPDEPPDSSDSESIAPRLQLLRSMHFLW